MKLKLTARGLAGLKARPDGRRETYWDELVSGLLVDAHASGQLTFGIWYRVRDTGRAGRLKLGRYEEGIYELADAREEAREKLRLARKGIDPAEAKRRDKAAGTFGDLVESFLADAKTQIRQTTHEGWSILLRAERLAGLRSKKTTDITRGDLVRVFDAIRDQSVAAGGRGYSANRTLEAVRRVFSWARSKDLIAVTPCVGIAKPVREQSRRRYYSDAELGAIVRGLGDVAVDDAIRLALWTGVRIEQALGAPWTEFDLDRAEWLIGGERAGNKNGIHWLVPLVPEAVEMLKRRPKGTWVFAARLRDGSGGEGSAWRSQRVVYGIRERSGVADFRPHDLRRTLNTWLASRAGGAEPQAVRDAILGHKPARLEGTYNVHDYADEKRAALERWAAHVARVAAKEQARVLPMRASA